MPRAGGEYRAFVSRARDLIEPLLYETPPDLASLGSFGPAGFGGLPLATVVHLANAARRFGRHELGGSSAHPADVRRRLAQRMVRDRRGEGRPGARGDSRHVGRSVVARNGGQPAAPRMHDAAVGGGRCCGTSRPRSSARARQYGVKIRTDAEVTSDSAGGRCRRRRRAQGGRSDRRARRRLGARPAHHVPAPHRPRHAPAQVRAPDRRAARARHECEGPPGTQPPPRVRRQAGRARRARPHDRRRSTTSSAPSTR